MEKQTLKTGPMDVFMHLLVIIALYWCGFNLIRLVSELVNVAFPDPLNWFSEPGSAVRWGIASLVVIFPVYLWGSRFLHRDLAAHPEKAELRIRRWLLYFTLFAAAVIIIGDLVALILRFLEGELTVRFILKVLLVLSVVAAVFGYYLYELKRKPGTVSPRAKIFVWVVIAAVAASVVGGFAVAGSPFRQRLARFDNQKVSDLQIIQNQIVNYWQQKNELPKILDDLTDSISGFRAPTDPQTGAAYEYTTSPPLSFSLCAAFNLSSSEYGPKPRALLPYPNGDMVFGNWDHPAGNRCFERTIDPELYRPNPVPKARD